MQEFSQFQRKSWQDCDLFQTMIVFWSIKFVPNCALNGLLLIAVLQSSIPSRWQVLLSKFDMSHGRMVSDGVGWCRSDLRTVRTRLCRPQMPRMLRQLRPLRLLPPHRQRRAWLMKTWTSLVSTWMMSTALESRGEAQGSPGKPRDTWWHLFFHVFSQHISHFRQEFCLWHMFSVCPSCRMLTGQLGHSTATVLYPKAV